MVLGVEYSNSHYVRAGHLWRVSSSKSDGHTLPLCENSSLVTQKKSNWWWKKFASLNFRHRCESHRWHGNPRHRLVIIGDAFCKNASPMTIIGYVFCQNASAMILIGDVFPKRVSNDCSSVTRFAKTHLQWWIRKTKKKRKMGQEKRQEIGHTY